MKKIIILFGVIVLTVQTIFGTAYYQSKLTDKEYTLYNQIASSLLNEDVIVEISPNYTQKQIREISNCVFKDYPQLFYVDQGYTYRWLENSYGQITSAQMEFSLKQYDKNLKLVRLDVEEQVNKKVEVLKKLDSPYQQIKTLYKYFALTKNYDISLIDDQSAYSVLIKNKGVCASYARSFQYIMRELDIPCLFVTGSLDGVAHAWNMVKIDGEWYHIDVTNGNSGYDDYCSYDFFLLPTFLMEKSVVIDEDVNLPIANSDKFNYFKNNSLYFTSFDKNKINNRIKVALGLKENGITFSFSNKNILLETKEYLIDEQNIYDIINNNSITYTINDKRNLLTIHF